MSWKIGGVEILFDGGDLDEGWVLLSTEKSQYLREVTARLKQKKF